MGDHVYGAGAFLFPTFKSVFTLAAGFGGSRAFAVRAFQRVARECGDKIVTHIDRVLRQDILVLDGGTGTEAQRAHGFKLTSPLWSSVILRESLETAKDIARAFIRAGAEIVETATFRSNPDAYAQAGLSQKESWRDTVNAAKKAREAVAELNSSTLVAGSIAPMRDCYDGKNIPSAPLMRENHFHQARALQAGGADLLIFETVPTLREAKIMVQAGANVAMPFILSFTVGDEGRLLDGTLLSKAARETGHKNRVAVGVNCAKIEDAEKAVRELLASGYRGTVAIYPNGISENEGPSRKGNGDEGWTFSPERVAAAETFTGKALELVKLVRDAGNKVIIGGCCGVTPLEVSMLAEALSKPFQRPDFKEAAREVASPSLQLKEACCPRHSGQQTAFACAAA